MPNRSNQKCPRGSERYHRYCRHRRTTSYLQASMHGTICPGHWNSDAIISSSIVQCSRMFADCNLFPWGLINLHLPKFNILIGSLLHKSISRLHPPKSIRDKVHKDTNDIASNASTTSRFTIRLPMKNDPE
jgi:hypothetical protein